MFIIVPSFLFLPSRVLLFPLFFRPVALFVPPPMLPTDRRFFRSNAVHPLPRRILSTTPQSEAASCLRLLPLFVTLCGLVLQVFASGCFIEEHCLHAWLGFFFFSFYNYPVVSLLILHGPSTLLFPNFCPD